MNVIQCRIARCALGWTTRQLATAAEVPIGEVMKCLVTGDVSPLTIARLRPTFEAAGLYFVDEDRDFGPGIRLRKGTGSCDYPRPAGPATDVIERMEAEIAADRLPGKNL